MEDRHCFVALALALSAICPADAAAAGQKTAEEASFFDAINDQLQNATRAVEQMLGVDIPSTQAEVQAAIRGNLDRLKQSAQSIQKKLGEYNVTGSSLSDALRQAQAKLDSTVKDLTSGNPDLSNMLQQVQTGYNNLAEVGKKVGDAVGEQAGGAQTDLRALAEHARTELQTAATKLQTQVNDLMTAQSMKTT